MNRRPIIHRWAAALIIGILAALAVPIVSTLRPEYYRRYPALVHRMDHWSTSTHSRISCIECHVPPGTQSAVRFAVRSIPAFYSQLSRGPDETNLLEAPGREACQSCHTGYRRIAPDGDLLIPHQAHVEALGMECVTCHKNLVHSFNRRGFNRPEMEGCLERCHDGATASADCVDCHTRKQIPLSHLQAEWLRSHGAYSETGECAECHDWTPGYCAECHEQRPESHAGNWKTDHARSARVRGSGCSVCHGGEEFCATCH